METPAVHSHNLEPVEGFDGNQRELNRFLTEFFGRLETVIWDGDNTLWNWMTYAIPAYEAMQNEIARIAEKSPEETAAAMKAFYTEVGTIEHEGLVQGLQAAGFFRNVPNFNLEDTIQRAQTAFNLVRRQHLHVYDGIRDVMEAMSDDDLNFIAKQLSGEDIVALTEGNAEKMKVMAKILMKRPKLLALATKLA